MYLYMYNCFTVHFGIGLICMYFMHTDFNMITSGLIKKPGRLTWAKHNIESYRPLDPTVISLTRVFKIWSYWLVVPAVLWELIDQYGSAGYIRIPSLRIIQEASEVPEAPFLPWWTRKENVYSWYTIITFTPESLLHHLSGHIASVLSRIDMLIRVFLHLKSRFLSYFTLFASLF